MPVKITKNETKKIAAAIKLLSETKVMVGIPAANAGRKNDDEEQPVSNAVLGYIHEFGAPEVGIPPRPFLVPGIASAKGTIEDWLKHAGAAALDGDPVAAENRLASAGLVAQNAVRGKIQQGPFVPLRPATLARRRARGRTGEKPLIDTGQLRNSITYVLRKVTGNAAS